MNYYDLLEIEKTATESEIKKAFRKKSKEMHPDLNPDPAIADQFKKIIEAYNTLSDPEKREYYDQYGENKPKNDLEAQVVSFFTTHILPLIIDQCNENYLKSEDLVIIFKEIIQEQIDLQKRDKKKITVKIDRLNIILDRLSCKEENNPIMESWLSQRDQLLNELNIRERDIKFLEIVMLRSQDFTYKFQ